MVEIAIDPNTQNGFIRLSPNQSTHWHVVLLLVSMLSLIIFIIALYMTSKGAWVVLPFSGIEIVGIVLANYFVLHRNAQREVIAFSDDTITIERGKKYPCACLTLLRKQARSQIIRPQHAWYPSKVMLCTHNNENITIGSFLNEEDQLILITTLNAVLTDADRHR